MILQFYVKYGIINVHMYIHILHIFSHYLSQQGGSIMAQRTAKNFSRKEIFEVAKDYAETDPIVSAEYFCQKYDISPNTFYTVLDKAVIDNIVDNEVFEKMKAKAAYNSGVKAGPEGSMRSFRHYRELFYKRAFFNFSQNEAIKLAEEYSESEEYMEEFANHHYMTTQIFTRTIEDTIVNRWITEGTLVKIFMKSLRRNHEPKHINYWRRLLDKRFQKWCEDNKKQG